MSLEGPAAVDLSVMVGIGAGLAAAWLLLLLLLWLVRPRDVSLTEAIRLVPDVLRLVRTVIADPAMPFGVRAALVGLVVWLVSPIDVVPEFLPVIGPLDDVIVAVLVLRYVRRRLGEAELRRRWPGTDDGYRLLARLLG